MSLEPTAVHTVEEGTIPEEMPVDEALAKYGFEGRRVGVVDAADGGMVSVDGDEMAFLSDYVYRYLVAMKAPTSKAGDRWFECPVTGDWLPVSKGVMYRGRMYSARAAADLSADRRNSKSASASPSHWSDDGSVGR